MRLGTAPESQKEYEASDRAAERGRGLCEKWRKGRSAEPEPLVERVDNERNSSPLLCLT